jgi:MFS family permease
MVAVAQGFSFLDRQIVTILLPMIKAELHVSDTQLGIMSGLAFALFYAAFGIPLARLADRWSRRNLMAISIAIWSGMTTFSGFVQSFPQLVLARFGVGVGEAGCAPAAFSLISDYFTKERRQTAAAIVNLGPQMGIVLGLLIGGLFAPIVGWRGAFFVAGLPGLLFSILFALTVREPVRGMADGVRIGRPVQPPFLSSLAVLWKIRSYRYVVMCCAMFSFSCFAMQIWMPSFLARSHGMQLGAIGPSLALATAFGAVGTITGGVLGDRLFKRSAHLSLLMPMIGGLAAIPLMAGCLLTPSSTASVAFFAAAFAANNLHVGAIFALTQTTSPLRLRALGISFLVLTTSLIGLGLGPFSVGVLSDHLTPVLGQEALRWAMLAVSASYLIPVVLAWTAGRTLKQDIASSAAA